MNQLCCAGANRMDAQQATVLTMKEEFDQTAVITKNLSPCDLSVPCNTGFVGNALLGQDMLRRSGHGNFRNRINAYGQMLGERVDIDSECVASDLTALRCRGRSETGIADDVARSKDMGDFRPKLIIHRQATSLIGGESSRTEVESIGSSDSAHGVEDRFSHDALPGLEGYDGKTRLTVSQLEFLDCFSQTKRNVPIPHLMHQFFHDLGIQKVQKTRSLVYQCDVDF